MANTASEAVRVTLLKARSPMLRLDVAPFAVIYALLHAYAWTSLAYGTISYETLAGIPVALAAHLLLFLSTRWSVSIRCWVAFRTCEDKEATHALALSSTAALCELKEEAPRGRFFSFQRRIYVQDVSGWRPHAPKTQRPLAELAQCTGLETNEQETTQRKSWGPNAFQIEDPTFSELFEEHYLAPFFVFQVFCCVLWSLDEYWVYSAFTLVMLLLFEATLCVQRLRNLEQLRSMRRPARLLYAYRQKKWRPVMSDDVVPGDVIALSTSQRRKDPIPVPCDCLLLGGSAVVSEAMLTGESVPQRKEGLVDADLTPMLDVDGAHRKHVLFGGTDLLDSQRGESARQSPPNGGVEALVLRTGFETAQGSLMRTILFATEQITGSTETGKFIGVLLIFAVVAALYVLQEGLKDPRRNRFKLGLHCILIITSVVPPELPMELSLAVTNSLQALGRSGIFCTEPFRIQFAGAVDVCCFDKTGTLTSDELTARGVALSSEFIDDKGSLPADTLLVLASCHAVSKGANGLLGDSLEKAQLQFAGVDRPDKVRILKRYGFSSELRRMTCVCTQGASTVVTCKGAPETLKPLLRDVPADYDASYEQHASRGMRVLALASRTVSNQPDDRSTAEADLTFRGFLCLTSPLKPGTSKVIQHLQASGHKCVIITGDNVLTAAHVARSVGILGDDQTWVLTANGESPVWRSGNSVKPFAAAPVSGLCCRGDALASLSELQVAIVASRCSVFARFSPKHKEKIVDALNKRGVTTLMCGDGTNDVGALKRAHVGVSIANAPELEKRLPSTSEDVATMRKTLADAELSLSDQDPSLVRLGDASIASPFTSKRATIECVLAIVCQGRCTLVSMIQIFKILAVLCLVSAYMLSSLYLHGVKQGDAQMTVSGILTAALFFLTSRANPLETLSKKRPPRGVFELKPILSIGLQFAAHLQALFKCLELCAPFASNEKSVPDGAFAPSVLNTAIFLLTSCVQLNTFACNYVGRPFTESLREHKPMLYVLLAGYAVVFLLAAGLVPPLSDYLRLVAPPSSDFRARFLGLLLADSVTVAGLSFVA
jgi:cation-transporting ATPase 13A1